MGKGAGFPKRKAVKEGKRLTNFPVGCTIITLCESECVAQYHTWKGLRKRPKKYRPKISCRFPCFKTSNSLESLSGRNIVLFEFARPWEGGSAQGPDGGGGRGPGCPPARVENRPGGKKRDPREKQEDPGHRAARARVNIIRLCLGRRSRGLLVVVVVVDKASSATQNEEAARSVGV